ncbi:DUF255 domain-containing protein [Halobaculum sp. MBLA0147]|uniref:DUF255 domain-containing protein n=1 Tax=Halobaculum sp. MBLA0147 TaxID=3079934 RepID=UPI003525E87D
MTDDATRDDEPVDTSHVEWHEWGAEPFEIAERTGRPVLLFLTATWCDDCHQMLAETFGEPRTAANVDDGFVPVKVDVDRQPRVRERYNMGGFPSTVFCTPDGEVLTGATYLAPDGFRGILDKVRERWDAQGTAAGRVPRALAGNDTPSGELSEAIPRHFAGQLDRQWDEEFAGWGTDAKFPLPDTVAFALKRDRQRAVATLDAIRRHLQGPDGGFYRYAAGRDWSGVHRERLLVDDAALLRTFAHGYLYTGEEAYHTAADRAAGFLRDQLRVGDAFGGSVGPDGDRRDLTAYADGNALAADALLWLAAYTDDDEAREDARGALRYLRETLIGTGADTETGRDTETAGRVRHFDADDAPVDLLSDAGRVVRAFTTAAQVLGEGVDVAAAVADRAVAELGDEDGFRDGPAAGVGLLDRPLRPIDGTVALAEGLLDLAALTGADRYRDRAERGLAAFADATERMGPQVAGYGAAVDRCLSEPLVVAVGDGVGSDLHRAALRVADHEKVVVPDADDAPDGAAVIRGRDVAPAETPDELLERIGEATS